MLRRVAGAVLASFLVLTPVAASADPATAQETAIPATPASAAAPVPPVAEPAPEVVDPWRGLYTRIELAGLFALGHHDTVEDGSVYGASVAAEGSGLFGGGVGLHVGYSLGEIGIEGLLQLAYDHSSVEAAVDPTRTDKWTFHRPGGTLAAMARWLPKMGPLRPTAGFGLGLSGRAMGYTRVVDNTRDKLDLQFYMTPTIILDGGLMIGKTPGGKLYFGLQLLVDLPSRQTIPSATSKDGRFQIPAAAKVETSTGPEVFLGPVFGLALGH